PALPRAARRGLPRFLPLGARLIPGSSPSVYRVTPSKPLCGPSPLAISRLNSLVRHTLVTSCLIDALSFYTRKGRAYQRAHGPCRLPPRGGANRDTARLRC